MSDAIYNQLQNAHHDCKSSGNGAVVFRYMIMGIVASAEDNVGGEPVYRVAESPVNIATTDSDGALRGMYILESRFVTLS